MNKLRHRSIVHLKRSSRRKKSLREDPLHRLTKLAALFGLILPLSAAIYGAFQLFLDVRKVEADIQIKSLDVALKYTQLKAEGKLGADNRLLLLDTLLTMPIDERFAAIVEGEVEEAKEILRLSMSLGEAKGEREAAIATLDRSRQEARGLRAANARIGEELLNLSAQHEVEKSGYKKRLSFLSKELEKAEAASVEASVLAANAESRVRDFQSRLAAKGHVLEKQDDGRSSANEPRIGGVDVEFPSGMFRYPPLFGPPGLVLPESLLNASVWIRGTAFGESEGFVYFCENKHCRSPLRIDSWSPTVIRATIERTNSVSARDGFIPSWLSIGVTTSDSRFAEPKSVNVEQY